MKKQYNKSVLEGLNRIQRPNEILKESDLKQIPPVVAKYINFTGAVGRPVASHFFMKTSGKIRGNPDEPWMKFKSEQYNFTDLYERFFYIKAIKSGIPAYGLHSFKNGKATMKIKLLGLFSLIDTEGTEMDQSETVTFFNDMCMLAPCTLTDPNIEWDIIDDYNVMARFKGPSTISAKLTFHKDGRLIDFRSEDRYELIGGKSYRLLPWRTPVSEYGTFHGLTLPKRAEAIYERPDGDFTYITLSLDDIILNPLL